MGQNEARLSYERPNMDSSQHYVYVRSTRRDLAQCAVSPQHSGSADAPCGAVRWNAGLGRELTQWQQLVAGCLAADCQAAID